MVSKTLLYRESSTPENQTLSEFIDFVNNFKSGNYKFQNGSNINITDSDILHIKNLFESFLKINITFLLALRHRIVL